MHHEIGFNNAIMVSGLVSLYIFHTLYAQIYVDYAEKKHDSSFRSIFLNKIENGMQIVMQL